MIKKQGFVAILDILGFADRVARDAEVGGLDKYIDTVVNLADPYKSLGTILFSDTVVLYTFDDELHSFRDIVSLVSRLSFSLLMEEVPLRGAIAHGLFARSEQQVHGTVIAGRPIIEAHYYEAQLQWIGVMLAPSVLRAVPDLAKQTPVQGPNPNEAQEVYCERVSLAARIQQCSKIPVASTPGAPVGWLEGFAVVPISAGARTPEELKKSISTLLWKLRSLKPLAPEPRSQDKYQNSIVWLQELHLRWIRDLK
ncbi:MAG: hypothetical protein ABSB32_08960 [Thermodesulfobacteriota bacterium]